MTETSSYPARQGVQALWDRDKEPELNLSLEVRISDDVAVVVCKGRIVYCKEVAALSYTVTDLLPQARQVVLDLSQVETIDGAGLGELLALLAGARARDCVMTLAAPSKGVRELLDLTRVASAFEIHDKLDDALLAARVPGLTVRRQDKPQYSLSAGCRSRS